MKIADPFVNFWYNEIGANIIPADTKNKTTHIAWSIYQNAPVPKEQIEVWVKQGAFDNGMAVIAGKLWRGPYEEKYLIAIDCDNQLAINEVCTRGSMVVPLKTLACKLLIEQHPSNLDKAHIYIISEKPFPKKSFDKDYTEKIEQNEVPSIEIKGESRHGIMYCTPSPHKRGDRYEIIGTHKPIVFTIEMANEYITHLNNICKKYNLEYLDKIKEANANRELFEPEFKVVEGHNRHEAVLRAMDIYLMRLAGVASESMIKDLSMEWNKAHCVPPIEGPDFERQWDCAKRFVETHIPDNKIGSIELPEIQRVLTKDLADENIIVEGQVHALEEMRQEITTNLFECMNCGVIYEDWVKTCTVKACKSPRIKRILNKNTLTDHRYIQLTLFGKEGQQDSGIGDVRIWISLYDKLAHTDLNLSDSIRVEGIVEKSKLKEKPVVEGKEEAFLYIRASQITPITNRKETIDTLTIEERNDLIEWAKNNDVVSELTSMFAPHIYGQDLVKESMLYQMVGAGYEGNLNRADVHILVIGDPSEGKTELALAGERVSGGEYSSGESVSAAGIGAGLVHDKITGRHVVEAGIAVKGNRKWKALDEIDKMPASYLNQLLTIMDKGFFKLDKVKHSLFETVGPWFCTGNPKDGRYNDSASILDNIGFPQPVLTRFDLIYILKRSYEPEKTAARLERINAQYTNTKEEIETKEAWLRKYLRLAKEIKAITIEPGVYQILEQFYHKLESSSEKGKGGIPITERQYHGMLRLSIARARLYLRENVTVEDAKRAIEIMNKMMIMSGIDPESGEVDMNVLRGKPASKTKRKEMARLFVQEIMDGNAQINLNSNNEEANP